MGTTALEKGPRNKKKKKTEINMSKQPDYMGQEAVYVLGHFRALFL